MKKKLEYPFKVPCTLILKFWYAFLRIRHSVALNCQNTIQNSC